MPELFDTHTHLYDAAFDAEEGDTRLAGQADAVRRAVDAGVTRMILPACEMKELAAIERLAAMFPGNLFVAAGIHPENLPAPDEMDDELSRLDTYIATHRRGLVAVGEIGIDLYWDRSRLDDQKYVFRAQCLMALKHDLPVIIHCREGLDEVLDVLASLSAMPRGVFHCFSGTADDVARIRRVGDFYFGIGGILTFKKSKLPEAVGAIPADRILLETDSPYMSPVPMRGRRNESAYLPYVAARLAEALGMTADDAAALTTDNALTLFGRSPENQ